MTDEIREELASEPSRRRLEELAAAAGLRTLMADGDDKVKAGITTMEEVLRVTQH
jgi:type II secretory ATPase GspE/PulE/Tfp pilus assembly ATPase PilB-like protein